MNESLSCAVCVCAVIKAHIFIGDTEIARLEIAIKIGVGIA